MLKPSLPLALACMLVWPHDSIADSNTLDTLVQQWLSLEQQRSTVEQDWRAREQSLTQGISLLQAEKHQLQQLLQQNDQQQDAVSAQRSSLLAQQQQLEQQQYSAASAISRLLLQLRALEPQLPPPLQQLWQQELADIHRDSDSSVILQRSLLLLSKLSEFQQRVNLADMTLSTDTAQAVRVRQLYLGAAQAWFASADGSYAGFGMPASDGWQWQFDNSVDAEQVLQAIAMAEKKAEARLITLPLHLSAEYADHLTATGAQP